MTYLKPEMAFLYNVLDRYKKKNNMTNHFFFVVVGTLSFTWQDLAEKTPPEHLLHLKFSCSSLLYGQQDQRGGRCGFGAFVVWIFFFPHLYSLVEAPFLMRVDPVRIQNSTAQREWQLWSQHHTNTLCHWFLGTVTNWPTFSQSSSCIWRQHFDVQHVNVV